MIDIDKDTITQLNKYIYNFFWKETGGNELIKRNTLQQNIELGGQKIPDIKTKIHAMRIQRIKDKTDTPWGALQTYWIGHQIKNTHPQEAKNKYQHTETLQNEQHKNIIQIYNKYKQLINWDKDKLKTIYYKIITDNREETTFKQKNPLIDELKIYRNINNNNLTDNEKDTLYTTFLNAKPTQEKLLSRHIDLETKTCFFCHRQIETLTHILLNCDKLEDIREDFRTKTDININKETIIHLDTHTKNYKHIAKYIFGIWKTRQKLQKGQLTNNLY